MNIVPGPDQHAAFIGKTGSGKTHLALKLIQHLSGTRPIYILDSKRDKTIRRLKNAERTTDYNNIRNMRSPIRIWTPPIEELEDGELIDRFLMDRYREGHNLTFIDEVSEIVGTKRDGGAGFRSLLTRGRSDESACWIGVQRPAGVTRYPFSESTCFYVFRLNDKEDRQRVAQFTHPALENPVSKRFQFWFYRGTDEQDEPHILGPI